MEMEEKRICLSSQEHSCWLSILFLKNVPIYYLFLKIDT